jgi:hypothetical protein
MTHRKIEHDYNKIKNTGTGGLEEAENYRIIMFPFEKYEIKIKLTPNNEFVEVIEVKINKDFLSYKQKATPKGFHDVKKFYPD